MIIKTPNRDFLKANVDEKKTELFKYLTASQRNYLRNHFDGTSVESIARACIEVARELGFTDLADEMSTDLETELTEV